MKTIIGIDDLKNEIRHWRRSGEKIGFVPTMGALHSGHLALVERVKNECDRVIVSIFVNPAQFGPNEDFSKYPRDLENDLSQLLPFNVDVVFCPNARDLYPDGFQTYVSNHSLALAYCGASRPQHFTGVCTIVLKLLNIVSADLLVLGQKDYQQFAVVSQMVKDLNIDTEILCQETVREKNGLALSSRNRYLSQEEQTQAPQLFQILKECCQMLVETKASAEEVQELYREKFEKKSQFRLEYFAICYQDTLTPASGPLGDRPLIALVAAQLGRTRLIDNILITARQGDLDG